jgi:hypothetical protein
MQPFLFAGYLNDLSFYYSSISIFLVAPCCPSFLCGGVRGKLPSVVSLLKWPEFAEDGLKVFSGHCAENNRFYFAYLNLK